MSALRLSTPIGPMIASTGTPLKSLTMRAQLRKFVCHPEVSLVQSNTDYLCRATLHRILACQPSLLYGEFGSALPSYYFSESQCSRCCSGYPAESWVSSCWLQSHVLFCFICFRRSLSDSHRSDADYILQAAETDEQRVTNQIDLNQLRETLSRNHPRINRVSRSSRGYGRRVGPLQ
jgi:hypothetical protein